MTVVTRACLTVPGDRADELLGKALRSGADEVVLDLEDAITTGAKDRARAVVADALGTRTSAGERGSFADADDAGRRVRVVVRVNAIDTPWLLDDLLALADLAPGVVDGVVVPKVEGATSIGFVAQVLRHRRGRDAPPLPLGALVETAAGLRDVDDALRVTDVDHVVVGFGDLAASLGLPTTAIGHDPPDADPWHAVRSRVLVAARAAGVRAIDGPFGDHADDVGLRRSTTRAHDLGFDGKWAIHPRQVAIINDVFAVAPEEAERARAVLDALDRAADDGHGAVALDGRMLDEASRALAERRVALAARAATA